MHLRGKWLIEISELAAFNKIADVETLKAFVTRRWEIYIPKYGRKERREPRQGVFVGTTNTDDWIKDETGARRFWPVKVVNVDLEWLAEYRDQLRRSGRSLRRWRTVVGRPEFRAPRHGPPPREAPVLRQLDR